ncbi:MAG: NUDIX hydrolase [Patescibacteria group bacterium]
MSKERFKITPASYLVLVKDEKFLMLRRYNTGYEDGNYSLVAGHLDGQETFRQAMAREAKEEAGIILNPNDLQVVHVMDRQVIFNDVGARERLDVFVKADDWSGELKNMEPHKCDDLSWFSFDKIPKNTIPYIKQALECIRDGVFYSEHGF